MKSMTKTIIRLFLSYFLVFGQTVAIAQTTAAILPQGVTQFLDNNGNPLSSGKVDFFIPNSSTRKTTWQDAAKTIANTNPVSLDAAGRAKIYGDGSYRQVVKTSSGSLIYDAVTASTGTGGGTVTGIGDGDAVGTIKPYSGLVAPLNYAFSFGQELSRTTYVDLFNAITLAQTITCSASNPTATGFSDTSQIPVGAVIEAGCFAPGTVVVSKTPTSVTFNNNASLSSSVSARIFLYGNGNGSTTFNIPDLRGYVVAGRTNMGGVTASNLTTAFFSGNPASTGGKGGTQSISLGTANLPPYTPTGTISQITPAGSLSGTLNASITDPGHNHNLNPYVGGGSAAGGQITPISGGGGGQINVSSSTTGISATVNLASGTFTGTPTTPSFTGTAQGGTQQAFPIVQPTQTLNYIIKITPDVAGIAGGIMSLIGDCTATGVGDNIPIVCTKTNGVSFGTMAIQNASSVSIANGTGNFSSLTLNGVPIGTSTDSYWSLVGGGPDIQYSSGRVGINNTTPSGQLDICNASTAADCFATITTAGGSLYKNGLQLRNSGPNYGFDIYANDTISPRLQIRRHENSAGGTDVINIYRTTGNIEFPGITNCGQLNTSSTGLLGCDPIVQITPEQSGAVCDNSTDNTAAFGALAARINSLVSVVVNFAPNCIYRVIPTPTPSTSTNLMNLSNLNGVTFNCNGSTIASMGSFPTINTSVYLLVVDLSKKMTFNDCNFTQPNYSTLDFQRGTQAFAFSRTNDVIINNASMTNGVGLFRCTRATPNEIRSNNYVLNNMRSTNTYYNVNAIKCPDNLTANIWTSNPGRSYFPYNVWNHKVQVTSNACAGPQDVLISNSYDVLDTDVQNNVTRDITLNYENSNYAGCTGTGPNAYVQTQFGTVSTAGPNEISNLNLNINVRRSDAGPSGPALRFSRGVGVGVPAAGRRLTNVTVTGSWSTNETSPAIMQLWTDDDWTGEVVHNITIQNFTCNGFGNPFITLDGRGLNGPLRLENLFGNGACNYNRSNTGTPNANGWLSYNQVFMPTLQTAP